MLTMGVLRMSISIPSVAMPAVECEGGSGSWKLATMMSSGSDATTGDSNCFCGAMRLLVGCDLDFWGSISD